jgi:hypothetical protein
VRDEHAQPGAQESEVDVKRECYLSFTYNLP